MLAGFPFKIISQFLSLLLQGFSLQVECSVVSRRNEIICLFSEELSNDPQAACDKDFSMAFNSISGDKDQTFQR